MEQDAEARRRQKAKQIVDFWQHAMEQSIAVLIKQYGDPAEVPDCAWIQIISGTHVTLADIKTAAVAYNERANNE